MSNKTRLQTNNINLQDLIDKANNLPDAGSGGGIDTSDATASARDILDGKTAYVNGQKITGTIAFQPAKTITPGAVSQTAVPSGYYTNGDITVEGDSNLVAENIKNGTTIFGVAGTYEGSGGGDTSIEDGLITKTLTTYTNSRVSSIGNFAFYSYTSLTSVSFPNCISIGLGAFLGCFSLPSVSFPNCTYIGSSAFYNCSKLVSVSFPNCTYIGSAAFYRCSALTSVSFLNCTYIGSNAFAGCTSLTSVNFPSCTTISYYAFRSCSNLTSVNFPNCSMIGSCAFSSCNKLTSADFPNCTIIGSSAFIGCSKLITIYLMHSSICKLSGSNAFSKTSIWSDKGSIFVPASLVSSYKKATNWAFFSNRIFAGD